MKYVRIRTYYEDGKWSGCEQLYLGDNQVKAISRFRKVYPEHDKLIIVAEPYESEDPKFQEHFKACIRCGCVN